MKIKTNLFGIVLIGILFLTVSLSNSVAIEDEPSEPEKPVEHLFSKGCFS